jgi:hypothetical protein
MSRTAVVILNHNGENLLQQFLPAVIAYSPAAEIIVADNASTDQSIPILQRDFPQVRLILLDKNYGFCGGYNRALKQVSADYVVLLNSDVAVTPEWLTPMTRLLDEDPRIAVVQPKICAFHQKDKFEHAGAAGGFIDSIGYPFCRGRIFDEVEFDTGQYDDIREIFWATGACCILRLKTFLSLGGFDEDFFAHMEEIDLCWKIHRTAQRVCYCGKSTVYHVGAGTLPYGNPKKIYLNFRNGLSLIYKHLPPGELRYKFPLRLLLDGLASVRFLAIGEPRNGWAVIRAYADFFKHLGRDRAKRKVIQQSPTYSRSCIVPGSIIIQHFLLGKQKFEG